MRGQLVQCITGCTWLVAFHSMPHPQQVGIHRPLAPQPDNARVENNCWGHCVCVCVCVCVCARVYVCVKFEIVTLKVSVCV